MTNWVRHGWFFLGPEVGHAIRLVGAELVITCVESKLAHHITSDLCVMVNDTSLQGETGRFDQEGNEECDN